MTDYERAITLVKRCRQTYEGFSGFLDYQNPFQLLIMVILSAQTTDAQVNACAPALFNAYPDAYALAKAPLEQLESLIRSTGYFRAKARNIQGAAQALVEHHGGEVPATMAELVALPGVGRKTAGVVLHHVFDQPAIIVDTHFGRVCRRLGFSKHEDPVKLEMDLATLLDKPYWGDASMLFNLHGRRFCHAHKPKCTTCFMKDLCPSAEDDLGKS